MIYATMLQQHNYIIHQLGSGLRYSLSATLHVAKGGKWSITPDGLNTKLFLALGKHDPKSVKL